MSMFGDYMKALDDHTEAVISGARARKENRKELGATDYAYAVTRIVFAYALIWATFVVWLSWLQHEASVPAYRSSLDGLAFESKKIWNNPGGEGRGAVHKSTLVISFTFWLTNVVVIDHFVMPSEELPSLCAVLGLPMKLARFFAVALALLGGQLRFAEYGKEWALEGNEGGAADGIQESPGRDYITHQWIEEHGDGEE